MTSEVIKMLISKKKSVSEDRSYEIISEIKRINNELEKAYDFFQNQTDDDLLEASIYNIKALKSRHSYLIKLARNNNVEAEYMNFRIKEKIKNA